MIVYTGGTFDLLHAGHIDLLNWCRDLAGEGGKVILSLNTDEFVEEYKGKKPVFDYEQREAMLLAFRGLVDEIIPNSGGKDSKPAILEVKPDIIAVGSDWLSKDYCKQMDFTPQWLEEQRIALVYIPRHIYMSSSEAKRKIREG